MSKYINIIIEQDDNGKIWANIPMLDGGYHIQGQTVEELMNNLKEPINKCIYELSTQKENKGIIFKNKYISIDSDEKGNFYIYYNHNPEIKQNLVTVINMYIKKILLNKGICDEKSVIAGALDFFLYLLDMSGTTQQETEKNLLRSFLIKSKKIVG